MWVVALPSTSKIGRARPSPSSLPPAMMERFPLCAAGSPPETGASIASTPWSDSTAATRREVAGAIVDMSM
jgi:hypothetical protein